MENKLPCPACGGSGQLSSFKGESRFLLTVEECPLCGGTGLAEETTPDSGPEPSTHTPR
jgi:DnaJ-class molecular chaperone